MPAGRSHQISDHHALPPSGSLSDEQFGQLLGLLDDQHQALVALLEPIQKVAALLLADREPVKPEMSVSGPDNDGPGSGSEER